MRTLQQSRKLAGRRPAPRLCGAGLRPASGFTLMTMCLVALILAIPAFAGFDRISGPQPGQSVGVLPPGVTPPQLEGVGVDEHLGRAVDLKLQFTDESGYQVS